MNYVERKNARSLAISFFIYPHLDMNQKERNIKIAFKNLEILLAKKTGR